MLCLILSWCQAQKYNDKLKAETHSTVKIFHQVTLFLNSRACTPPCEKKTENWAHEMILLLLKLSAAITNLQIIQAAVGGCY